MIFLARCNRTIRPFMVFAPILLGALLSPSPAHAQAVVRYVDANATSGAQTGLSWPNAHLDLQPALNAANDNPSITQIWVAKGPDNYKYKPSVAYPPGNTDPRSKTYWLKRRNLGIYGGFAGTRHPSGGEISLSQIDTVTNEVILSGDLGGNDNPADPFGSNTSENAYHVVTAYGPTQALDDTARLEALSITSGNANGTNSGGGLVVLPSPPFQGGGALASRCTFRHNQAPTGGAVGVEAGIVELVDCRFFTNMSLGSGGAVYAAGTVNAMNCLFAGNVATGRGGAIYGTYSPETRPVVRCTNSTFSNNTAGVANGGGAISKEGGIFVRNCILYYDAPDEIEWLGFGTVEVTYTQTQETWTGTGNLFTLPQFINAAAGNYRLACGSPCIDSGDPASNNPWPIGSPPGIPNDVYDIDHDVSTSEKTPDLDLYHRLHPYGLVCDRGAYESHASPTCRPDIDPVGGDCCVNVNDLLAIINGWGTHGGWLDMDPPCGGDGTVNVNELLAVIQGWGPCCSQNPACCEVICPGPPSPPQDIIDCMNICAGAADYAACLQKCLCGLGYQTCP